MSLVPHGCTIRTHFDRDTESFLRQLSLQIQSNVSQFVAQENADVSLRERKPFHITLLEISPLLSVPYVLNSVNAIAFKTSRLVGKVQPFCQVCENGEVRVKVNCPDITRIGQELVQALPGSNGWFSQTNDSLFITIGVFHGIHRFDFETWLNKELSTNNDLFPTFHADYLFFSDEWLYVAHAHEQTVALRVMTTGLASNSALQPDVKTADGLDALSGIDGDMAGLLDSFTLAADETAMANVDDDDEKTGAAQAGKQEAEGAEAEPPAPPAENVPYQATTAPDGGSVWGSVKNGKIAPPRAILAMREGTKATAKTAPANAAKRAAAPVNVASKPTSASPAAAQPAEVKPKEVGKAASATHDHADARASGANGPNWECPSCKVVVYGRRAVCFKCKTAKPAGASAAAMPAGAAAGVARVAPAGAAAAGGGAGAPAGGSSTYQYPRKPKDGDVRDGDWICSGCKGHNFASKIACFTCRTPRPPGYVIDTPDAANGDGAKADRKPGDWTCPKCTENVFAKRNRCYKCSTSKPKNMAAEGV